MSRPWAEDRKCGTGTAVALVTVVDQLDPHLKELPKHAHEALAIVLIILWALGFFAIHVGGSLIHLLLVIALIVIIYRLVTGRRPVV